jgi:hypothetical protein
LNGTLDQLDLELRCLPGVVAVGVADTGEALVVQVVVTAEHAGGEVRDQIRRITRAHLDRPMVLEVVVHGQPGAGAGAEEEAS